MDTLRALGIRARSTADLERAREQLNDLYRFELKRDRIAARELEAAFGPQSSDWLRSRVQSLRRKYWLLSLPLERWRDD